MGLLVKAQVSVALGRRATLGEDLCGSLIFLPDWKLS